MFQGKSSIQLYQSHKKKRKNMEVVCSDYSYAFISNTLHNLYI